MVWDPWIRCGSVAARVFSSPKSWSDRLRDGSDPLEGMLSSGTVHMAVTNSYRYERYCRPPERHHEHAHQPPNFPDWRRLQGSFLYLLFPGRGIYARSVYAYSPGTAGKARRRGHRIVRTRRIRRAGSSRTTVLAISVRL